MILATKIVISLVILVWIIWPFISKKKDEGSKTVPVNDVLLKLTEQKEHAYAAIKELDFDYNMGKLSEEDYKELKQQYKQDAVSFLQQIDALVKANGTANG